MMSADTLPTASELRSALEMIDSAVLSDTLAHEPRPLLALAQGAALAGQGDRIRRQALLTALVAGLRTLGGDGWRGLTGQPALDLVRRALDEAGRMDR
jgi:hypothetical protein